jgi:hypothetical protein
MIKLITILKEIADEVTGKTWYHGSVADINQNNLDPLHRESEKYKGDADKQKWSSTGSSRGGVGIYFGLNKTEKCTTCPIMYTGFDAISAPYTQGFMYEMKLKPDANIKNYSALHNISKTQFDQFRKEGIDALITGDELNLLNPEAVQYFKKIQYWKGIPVLYPLKRGKAQTDKAITFNNEEELKNYLTKELGDYKLNKLTDRQLYLSSDENKEGFEYTTNRKWFNT